MKLKNKKTGEITDFKTPLCMCDDKLSWQYDSLRELEEDWEDWEDVEEPKKYWTIDWTCQGVTINKDSGDDVDDFNESIGNYFDTQEEAELAVRKLKAWKRLKDKGFCFCGTDCVNKNNVIYFEFGERPLTQSEVDEAEKDLITCFGGEE